MNMHVCVWGNMVSDVILIETLNKIDFLKMAGIENGLQGVRPEVRRVLRRLRQEVTVGWGGGNPWEEIFGMWNSWYMAARH